MKRLAGLVLLLSAAASCRGEGTGPRAPGDWDLRRAGDWDYQTARRYYQLAEDERRAGREYYAAELLRRSWTLFPDFAPAARRLSEFSRRRGEARAAVEYAKAACRVDPENPRNLLVLARALLSAGQREEARRYLQRIAAEGREAEAADDPHLLSPMAVDAVYRLALLAAEEGRAAAALQLLRRAAACREEYALRAGRDLAGAMGLADQPAFRELTDPARYDAEARGRLAAARRQAAAEKKKTLVVFHSSFCSRCAALVEALGKPGPAEVLAAGFVPVLVDVQRESANMVLCLELLGEDYPLPGLAVLGEGEGDALVLGPDRWTNEKTGELDLLRLRQALEASQPAGAAGAAPAAAGKP